MVSKHDRNVHSHERHFSFAEVRELCDKKFSKYGPNSVKIFYKNQERVAFVNFTSSEDARKARHAKTGLVWENLQVFLEP